MTARAKVTLQDNFTIYTPSANGYVRLAVIGQGPETYTSDCGSYGCGGWLVHPELRLNGTDLMFGYNSPLQTISIPFTSGVPVPLSVSAGTHWTDLDPNSSGGGNGTSFSLVLDGIVATDVNGNELTDWTYSTESGFRYSPLDNYLALDQVTATPEPSSVFLMALPLAALGASRLRFFAGRRN
ncbi:MAG: hypothetical protein H7039_17295 [Bryobacteraceae bacterium]|nr:hypothetical protein [Bryobacteraceae bacterium]